MKKLFFALAVSFSVLAYAQDTTEESKEGWKKGGTVTFLFNQSAFSNWVAGGEDNIAGNLSVNYDFNYVKDDWTWDNKLIASYGITKVEGRDLQKTDDRLEFNSLAGKKANGNWFYSAFLNFKTQMDSGFDSETGEQFSHFFSPAYLQAGPGMLWKKNDNLKINLAPATSRFIFVHGEFTDPNDPRNQLDADNRYFGVKANKTMRFELGAAVNAYYKLPLMPNVTMENILNLYTNYLEDPQNVDIDYTLNIVMAINKYLSTNLTFQTIYDDNAFKGFQTREILGVGVNFNL